MAVGNQINIVIVHNWARIQTIEFHYIYNTSFRILFIDRPNIYIMAMYLVTRAHIRRFTFIPDSSHIPE